MLLLYQTCHLYNSFVSCIQLNELLYTVAKVEQAFMVSPRTSSDRHQLEKVASATPLEGQLWLMGWPLQTSSDMQNSIYVGPCT